MSSRAGVQKHPRYRVSVPIGVVTPSGEVEEFTIEDISLGGLFVKTLLPAPTGSVVRLRLPVGDGALALMGRVVHVIDDDAARDKAHAHGMGVQFDGLAPDTEAALARFVGGLFDDERRRRDEDGNARFVDPLHVRVPSERSALARLWATGLARCELVAHAADGVRVGNRVTVAVGPLRLAADVIALDQGAARLRVVHLADAARAAIVDFIAGTADRISSSAEIRPAAHTQPVGNHDDDARSDVRAVLVAARRLLAHLETDDLHGALGLPTTASEDELLARVRALHAACTAARPHATPPQRARLDAAVHQLLALEGSLCGPPVVIGALLADTVRAELEELMAEADFLAGAGRPLEAEQALREARDLAPDFSGVQRRRLLLDQAANQLLDDAEQMRRDELIERARAVGAISTSRTVLLRTMRMLASAGATDDMLAVAQHLVDLDATDELPLFAMLQVNERLQRFEAAVRAGEALLRLRPDDYELQERVAALAIGARAGR